MRVFQHKYVNIFLFCALSMSADVFEHAFFALRTARNANSPAVQNQPVTEIVGFLRVKNSAKLRFAFCRVFGIGKTQQVRYTDAVGIANHRRFSVNVARHKVRGFAPYSGKLYKLLYGIRNHSAVIPNKDFAGL